jgi:hypothetical protein
LASLVLGLGAALGSVVVWEKFVDPSFHNAEELESAVKFPVVVTIPKITIPQSKVARLREQGMYVASLVLILCVVMGAMRFFAAHNTQLAMKFSSTPIGVSK